MMNLQNNIEALFQQSTSASKQKGKDQEAMMAQAKILEQQQMHPTQRQKTHHKKGEEKEKLPEHKLQKGVTYKRI